MQALRAYIKAAARPRGAAGFQSTTLMPAGSVKLAGAQLHGIHCLRYPSGITPSWQHVHTVFVRAGIQHKWHQLRRPGGLRCAY